MKNFDSQTKLSITDWSLSDRPREKYLEKGSASLSDAELIAILIRTGSRDESALDLAKRLLALNGNSLQKLAAMPLPDLIKVFGMGKVKAITIKAAFDLGLRRRAEKVLDQKKIKSATDLLELMQDKIANLLHEEFWVVYVNQGSAILGMDIIGKGGLTSTTVDVRMIMKKAMEYCATGIFLCHNHPSGNLKPSNPDITITNQIKEAAQIFNINLLDHLIVHKDNYYSFYTEGLI